MNWTHVRFAEGVLILKYILAMPLFFAVVFQGWAFDFRWEINETPEGTESATVVEPIQVVILDEVVDVPSYSASLALILI